MQSITKMEDKRNLIDKYKGRAVSEIFADLAERRNDLEVAIENVEHDFNIGTIVRSANSFNVAKVHIIGRRKYNRRGAMCTEKYLEVVFWLSVAEFFDDQKKRGREVIAIENQIGQARPLGEKKFTEGTTLVFGSERNGLSEEMLAGMDDVREIESFGSTRSVNVGVAAGIAMYEWTRQCVLMNGGAREE